MLLLKQTGVRRSRGPMCSLISAEVNNPGEHLDLRLCHLNAHKSLKSSRCLSKTARYNTILRWHVLALLLMGIEAKKPIGAIFKSHVRTCSECRMVFFTQKSARIHTQKHLYEFHNCFFTSCSTNRTYRSKIFCTGYR